MAAIRGEEGAYLMTDSGGLQAGSETFVHVFVDLHPGAWVVSALQQAVGYSQVRLHGCHRGPALLLHAGLYAVVNVEIHRGFS
jgi:hypothetical protein